ncbi:MAG TPA: pyridoxal-phosphate dependent enzyme [Calditrichia bacterium]|nr:pyridoxal-phosphate dependent enzyme [Calditrichota bacterium]HQV30913.1 pyridoxal-phosphate dependent enzyme [Calditrichia bacterium]
MNENRERIDEPPAAGYLQQQNAAKQYPLYFPNGQKVPSSGIDSRCGHPLIRAHGLERRFGLEKLFLKFEGFNPTGTQKDRIAAAQAADARSKGFGQITLATCGNYGVAGARAAADAGLDCVIFIPAKYHTRRITEMLNVGATIVRVESDYEGAVEASRSYAEKSWVYDANPGPNNAHVQLAAYAEIGREIAGELAENPALVAAPLSNGTTLAGVYQGFDSAARENASKRRPKIVGGSTLRQNPIVSSFLNGSERCVDLDPSAIRETSVNEPLVNWRAADGDIALDAIRESGGWAGYAADYRLVETSRMLRREVGIDVLPAATAGLVVLLDSHRLHHQDGGTFVAVLTGRRL